MAVYAQFDGMDGQAMDKGYEKWCILHDYQINASRNLMAGGAAQQSQQRVCFTLQNKRLRVLKLQCRSPEYP